MTLRKRPRQFIYLDEQGIKSLFAQTVEGVETARKETTHRNLGAKISGKLSFKQALLTMLGLPEAELKSELEGTRQRGLEISTELSTEHILFRLIENLPTHEDTPVFGSFAEAAAKISGTTNETYVSVVDEFDAPQFIFGKGVSDVNKCGALILEKNIGGYSHNYNDDYFKHNNRITLLASISKFPRVREKLGHTSHEGIYFRAYEGKKIPLGVFGSIREIPKAFQVKPFAIWMP